ncbi:GNAT family N-acetyltransferase [Companilactobacillus metriopterae]|uniref:GNAT family N-acetyltransferase n=1 Tax=Companilactobacillus metriopterae TaxID=1909267 RepID=UPI00100B842E|nr:GNAT family protein [Companilactobacillus metriopterae]
MEYYKVSEDITLKSLDISQAEEIYNAVDESRDTLDEWLSWVEKTKSIEDEKNSINMLSEKLSNRELWLMVIYYQDKLVGMIDIHNILDEHHRGEIGYWLSDKYSHRGIMHNSLKKTIDVAFNNLGIHRLDLLADIDNHPSRAVAKSAGFTEETVLKDYLFNKGTYRDVVLYYLINPEN